jgi:ribosomal protein S4
MERIKAQLETSVQPAWLSFDAQKFQGTVRALPSKENTEMVGSVGAILEYYSR